MKFLASCGRSATKSLPPSSKIAYSALTSGWVKPWRFEGHPEAQSMRRLASPVSPHGLARKKEGAWLLRYARNDSASLFHQLRCRFGLSRVVGKQLSEGACQSLPSGEVAGGSPSECARRRRRLVASLRSSRFASLISLRRDRETMTALRFCADFVVG